MLALALLLCTVDAAQPQVVNAATVAPPPAALLDVRWEGDSLLTGRIARLEVRAGKPIAALKGTLDGKPLVAVPASPTGAAWLALGAVSVDARPRPVPLALVATLADGTEVSFAKPVAVQEAAYDERQLTVGKEFLRPSRKQRLRAGAEARVLSRVLRGESAERLWRGSFAKPTAGGETSPFGTKRTYNGKKRSRHLGLDLDGKTGDAIVATNRGRVALATERFYSGGTVVLDHGNGLFTLYFHMSRIDVKAGEIVVKGQRLGAVGASGQVTGPHLHFAVRLNGLYVDPRHLLAMDLSADALDGPTETGPTEARPTSAVGEPRQAVP